MTNLTPSKNLWFKSIGIWKPEKGGQLAIKKLDFAAALEA